MQVLSQTAPERSLVQRFDALAKGNRKRTYRSRVVKAQLKARTLGLFDALDDPMCDTMKVRDVLLSVPGLGETKVDALLRDAQVSSSKTCAGITAQQRMRLAATLAHRHPHMPIVFRAPEHDSVLAARTMDA